MHRAYTAPHKSPAITGGEEAKMIVARVILMSAMLTAGIVEMTKTTAPHLAAEAPKTAPVEAPLEISPVVPVSTAPVVERACTETAWPYRPGTCLRPENDPQGPEPRRPVRMIEEQRPAPSVPMPGRVSFG